MGSVLYNAGGFKLPFFVVGSIGLVVATSLVFVIPNVKPDPIKKSSEKSLTFKDIAKVRKWLKSSNKTFLTYFVLFQSPSIFLPYLDLLICFFGNGMIASMLEPHLAEAGADPTQVGLTFLVFGAIFMVSTPLAGFVSDK